MGAEPSLWSFIVDAGFVVKVVLLILLLASVFSWTIIVQRILSVKQADREARRFEELFWSGIDLNQLHQQLANKKDILSGMGAIFYAGFTEYMRLHQQPGIHPAAMMEGAQRAMRVAQVRETENLEKSLSFLATVGSTSPYIGLFGTVWGIMTSFRGLGAVQQATIAMVAPGISEALIATAIGLFAAIPAVIAYNRFSNDVSRLSQNYDTFQEEFSTLLHRKSYGSL